MSQTESAPRYFDAAIKGGVIYERGYDSNPQVGVDIATHADLQDELDTLIDAFNAQQEKLQHLTCPSCGHEYSAIQVPLSLEEQVESLIAVNRDQAQQISRLIDQVNKLLGDMPDEQAIALPLERDQKGRFVAPENKRNLRHDRDDRQ